MEILSLAMALITLARPYDPALCGELKVPLNNWEIMPLDERKIICRRAAMELIPGVVINKDIIAQMGFRPHIIADLKLMDARIFKVAAMGIKAEIAAKN